MNIKCVTCEVGSILSDLQKLKREFKECLTEANQKIDHDIKMYLGAFSNEIQMMKVEFVTDQEKMFEYYLNKIRNLKLNRKLKKKSKKARKK